MASMTIIKFEACRYCLTLNFEIHQKVFSYVNLQFKSGYITKIHLKKNHLDATISAQFLRDAVQHAGCNVCTWGAHV